MREANVTEEQCKHGGYATFGLENQGQCVNSVKGKNRSLLREEPVE